MSQYSEHKRGLGMAKEQTTENEPTDPKTMKIEVKVVHSFSEDSNISCRCSGFCNGCFCSCSGSLGGYNRDYFLGCLRRLWWFLLKLRLGLEMKWSSQNRIRGFCELKSTGENHD